MRILATGRERDRIFDEVELDGYDAIEDHDHRDDLGLLDQQGGLDIRSVCYVFYNTHKFDSEQQDALSSFIATTDKDVIVLAKTTDGVPADVRDELQHRVFDEQTEGFKDAFEAFFVTDPSVDEIQKLKRFPLEWYLEVLTRLDPMRFPGAASIVDDVNRWLYRVDEDKLYTYLARHIEMPRSSNIFYGADTDFEDFVEMVSTTIEVPEPLVARNLRYYVARYYDELELDGSERDIFTSEQLKTIESAAESNKPVAATPDGVGSDPDSDSENATLGDFI